MSTPLAPSVDPGRILRTQWEYAPPLILAAAVRLRIFDLLAEGPQTVAEVAKRAGASERGVRSLLNGLVGLHFLTKEEAERYRLTPESDAFLVSGKPGCLGGMFFHAHELVRDWLDLAEVVRMGKPLGSLNQGEAGAAFFSELVVSLYPMNLPLAQALGRILGVAERREPMRILDIAAGSGVWGIALGTNRSWRRLPRWIGRKCWRSRVALPPRLGWPTDSRISGAMWEMRVSAAAFSLPFWDTSYIAKGRAAVGLCCGKTFTALAPGGTVAIAEFLVDADRSGPPMGVIFGLNMLLHTDEGDTFSFEEIASWLEDSGFVEPQRVDPGGPASLILAQKPGV